MYGVILLTRGPKELSVEPEMGESVFELFTYIHKVFDVNKV